MTQSAAERIGILENQVENLNRLVGSLIQHILPDGPAIQVTLYDKTHAWSSAPSSTDIVGRYGKFGQGGDPVWALEAGDYTVIQTYTVNTSDYGVVRWVQLRVPVKVADDGFAWVPVDPQVLDSGGLYSQLEAQDSEVQPDDFTQNYWDNN